MRHWMTLKAEMTRDVDYEKLPATTDCWPGNERWVEAATHREMAPVATTTAAAVLHCCTWRPLHTPSVRRGGRVADLGRE